MFEFWMLLELEFRCYSCECGILHFYISDIKMEHYFNETTYSVKQDQRLIKVNCG